MATFTVTDKNIDKVIRKLTRRNEQCLRLATANSLSRIAGRGARVEREQIGKHVKDPTPFTVKGIRFAKAKKTGDIDKMYSAVYIEEKRSAYLNTLIVGETITELYGRSPVISPVTGNLNRRGYGLGIKLNRFGNVPGLSKKSGKMKKVFAHPRTFEVGFPGNQDLSPGIYYRNKNGTVDKIFSYSRDSQRKAQWPFSDIALKVYDDGFGDVYREALGECFDD